MDIIWIGAAFVAGILLSRLNIPPLVGYLLAGIALSFTSYESGTLLKEISHLGVIFLLFTVGLHIKLKNIIQLEVLGVGFTHLAISTLLFTPLCLYFGLGLEAALFIGITLGFSSTVLTAKTLESRNELGAYYGRVAIGILIIQDLVAIGLIAYAGGGIPSPYAVALLGLPFLRRPLNWLLNEIKNDELLLLLALSLAIGGDILFQSFNLSGELGALVTGMLFATNAKSDQLEKKIWSIKEAFLVGFFLQTGLGGLPGPSSYWLIASLIVLLPIKGFIFYGLFMAFGLRSRTGYLSSSTLTAYSEFTLISGAVAASAGIIPAEYIVILGLVTAVSYSINVILVTNEDSIWDKISPLFSKLERDTKHPDHQPVSLGAAEYLVIGLGTAGCAAFKRYKEKGKRVVGLDIDPDVIEKRRQEGDRVVYADVQDSDTWEKLETDKIQSILLSMSSNINLKKHIVYLIRKKNKFQGNIYVLTSNALESQEILDIDAIPIAVPAAQVGQNMAEISLSNDPDLSLDINSGSLAAKR